MFGLHRPDHVIAEEASNSMAAVGTRKRVAPTAVVANDGQYVYSP